MFWDRLTTLNALFDKNCVDHESFLHRLETADDAVDQADNVVKGRKDYL